MESEKQVSSWEAYQEAVKIGRALKVFDGFEKALKVLAEAERRTQQYENEAKKAIAARDAALEQAEAVAQEMRKGEEVIHAAQAEAQAIKQEAGTYLKTKKVAADAQIQALQTQAQAALLKTETEAKRLHQEVEKLEKTKISLEGQLVDLRKQVEAFRASISTTFTKVI